MKATGLALVLLLADTSPRREIVDPSRFELLDTFGPWRASTLSPAGNALAVYDGKVIRLYDLARRQETCALTNHRAKIHDSGWSRDGRVFASSGYDGAVRVWDVASGKQLSVIAAHAGYA